MCILPKGICLHHLPTWYPLNSERVTTPRDDVMDGYEPLYGCWNMNPVPLQDQQVILTPKLSF